MIIESIQAFLEEFAPARLAESWDNIGLLVGDRRAEVRRIMTCLTIAPMTVQEAIEGHADLIVTHHPLPFSAIKRLTTDTTVGRMLLELIAARVAVYSPHTAFDSAAEGINQRLAEGLELKEIVPLVPHTEGQGAGRRGRLETPVTLGELADRLMKFLRIENLQTVGDNERRLGTVAVACGARGRVPRSGTQRWLRRDGAGRSPLSYLPGGRGLGHRPSAAGALCQRAFCGRAVAPEYWRGSFPRLRFGPAGRSAIPCGGPVRRIGFQCRSR